MSWGLLCNAILTSLCMLRNYSYFQVKLKSYLIYTVFFCFVFPILVLGHLGCFPGMLHMTSWSIIAYVFSCI